VRTDFGGGTRSAPNRATTGIWGDTNQTAGPSEPDVDDLVCEVYAFGGIFDDDCTERSADLMHCIPNRLIDVDDLVAVVDAYSGTTYPGSLGCPLACPGSPAGGGAPQGPSGPEGPEGPQFSQATIYLTADATVIKPGKPVTVRASVVSLVPLRADQVAVSVTGGTSATLDLETVTIDDTRTDYLFYGLADLPATDDQTARLAATLFSGSAPGSPQKYLGTFTFRASLDASGTFTISLRPAETLLRDGNSAAVTWTTGPPAQVTVEG
jgi:hypothetical protein